MVKLRRIPGRFTDVKVDRVLGGLSSEQRGKTKRRVRRSQGVPKGKG